MTAKDDYELDNRMIQDIAKMSMRKSTSNFFLSKPPACDFRQALEDSACDTHL